MAKKLEDSLLSTLTYNVLLQSIQQSSNFNCSPSLNSILFLLSEYNNKKNYFYIKENTGFQIFKDSENCYFKNLDKNVNFKSLERYNQSINKNYPENLKFQKVPIKEKYIGEGNENFKNYVERVLGYKQFDNLVINENKNDCKVMLEDGLKRIFFDTIYEKNKIVHYNSNKEVKNKLRLRVDVNLKKEKIESFSANHFFINVPTHRTKDGSDIKALDHLIKYIYDNTDYQKLILIGGDNDYKNYCWKNFKIPTTEKYEVIKTQNFLHKNNDNFISKNKSSAIDMIKDYLYIQESKAGYIHFSNFILKHPKVLDKINDDRIRYYYKFFACFDIGPILLKRNKLIYYET